MSKLTERQKLFVEEYLQCWNGAEAARRAGYSARTARNVASQLLARSAVAEAVRRRVAERAMTADEALMRLAEHARGEIGSYFVQGKDGKVWFDLERLVREGKGHLLRAVTVRGVRYEFYNAQAPLLFLAKHLGLGRERKEEVVEAVEVTVEEWRTELARLIEEEMKIERYLEDGQQNIEAEQSDGAEGLFTVSLESGKGDGG